VLDETLDDHTVQPQNPEPAQFAPAEQHQEPQRPKQGAVTMARDGENLFRLTGHRFW
jgi:hypothetical protein